MPFRTADPVLTIEESRMRNIDPQNPENLFGMWSVFHKCAGIIENGRRLENLSWRVFAHETLCISSPKRRKRASPSFSHHHQPDKQSSATMPPLSSSVESSSSIEFEDVESDTMDATSPGYSRHSFGEHSTSVDQVRIRGDKHITPLDLENLVISIKAKQHLTGPLSPLPLPSSPVEGPPAVQSNPLAKNSKNKRMPQRNSVSTQSEESSQPTITAQDTAPTPRPSSPQHVESSTSTIETDTTSPYLPSPSLGSDTSADSDLSHSVIRGFRTGNRGVSTYRSQSQLHLAPTTSQETPREPEHSETTLPRKKGGMFQLGGSLTEDEASLRDQLSPESQGSLQVGSMRRNHAKKHASFLEKVTEIPKRTFMLSTSQEDGNAIESDEDEEFDTEEEVSESAIEDDDDWEDEEAEALEEDGKKFTFARVDSKPNLVSRRSIITQGLHENQRASALQTAAALSTSSMRRSRNSTPNGPSLPASPEEQSMAAMVSPSASSNPIMLPTEEMLAPAVIPLSPRATRRNMLTSELGVSLRKHMLNERQQRNIPYPTTSTALPRRHTSHNMQNLTQYPEPVDSNERPGTRRDAGSSRNNSWTDYFDYGMGEYHQKGW